MYCLLRKYKVVRHFPAPGMLSRKNKRQNFIMLYPQLIWGWSVVDGIAAATGLQGTVVFDLLVTNWYRYILMVDSLHF